jgi:recombination protein RecR
VEDIRDVMAIENTNQFKGCTMLGGRFPIDGVGPNQQYFNIGRKGKK